MQNSIIAAVRTEEEVYAALESDVSTVFFLTPGIFNLARVVERAHAKGKKLFVHLDFAEGIGKKEFWNI